MRSSSAKSRSSRTELIRIVYSAAAEPELWRDVLDRIRASLHAEVAAFLVADDQLSALNIAMAVGRDPQTFQHYDRHWGARDPWLASGSPLLKTPGEVFPGQALIANSAIERTSFYHEFLRPNGLYQIASATVAYESDFKTYITANFDRTRGHEFGDGTLRFLRDLAPHIRESVRLHRLVRQAEAREFLGRELLERLGIAVILLDHGGKVLFANQDAVRLLTEGDGLTVRGGRLRCLDPLAVQTLEHNVGLKTLLPAPAPVVVVNRSSGRAPLVVRLVPVPDSAFLGLGNPKGHCMALVSDPDRKPADMESMLTRVFGLTKAEARIAAGIADGGTADTLAEQLGVSRETVRSHLKHVYSKLDVRRRGAAVARLRSLVAML